VGSASGDNRPIIDIRREGLESPGLGNMKEGENVQGRQDGGQRGSLWGAVVQDNFREGFAIKGEGNTPVSEEGANPCTQLGCKTEDGEDVNQAIDVEVVKETLDIKKEEACDPAAFDARLECVGHAKDGV